MEKDSAGNGLVRLFRKFKKIPMSNIFRDISKADGMVVMAIFHKEMCCGGKDGVKISELADMLHVSTPSMSRTIGHLEEKGLVVRTVDHKDRRNTYVSLSEEGHRISRENAGRLHTLMRRVTERYGEDKIELLTRYLDELHVIIRDEVENFDEYNKG